MIRLKFILFLIGITISSVCHAVIPYTNSFANQSDTVIIDKNPPVEIPVYEVYVDSIPVLSDSIDVLTPVHIDLPEDTLAITMPEFFPWQTVNLQGKLKMKGLPFSPTIKIFMQKDSLIDISIRAPFVGEAGRIEITPDSILAYNKMNKTYVSESIQGVRNFYPGGINDLQNLLLGRFFLPGIDVNAVDLSDFVEIYYEDNQYNVIPKGEAEIEGLKYGFVVDDSFNPLMLIVMPSEKVDTELYATYTYTLQGYNLQIHYMNGDKGIEVIFEIKNPEWGGDAPKGVNIDKKWRKLNLIDFMNSIG